MFACAALCFPAIMSPVVVTQSQTTSCAQPYVQQAHHVGSNPLINTAVWLSAVQRHRVSDRADLFQSRIFT